MSKPKIDRPGIHLVGAFFCTDFQDRPDGGHDAEQIHFNGTYALPEDTGVMLWLVVMVIGGSGSPTARVRIVGYKPNGEKHEFGEALARLSGAGIGHNVKVQISIVPMEGTFWFDIFINGVLATSVPFHSTRVVAMPDV